MIQFRVFFTFKLLIWQDDFKYYIYFGLRYGVVNPKNEHKMLKFVLNGGNFKPWICISLIFLTKSQVFYIRNWYIITFWICVSLYLSFSLFLSISLSFSIPFSLFLYQNYFKHITNDWCILIIFLLKMCIICIKKC